ncbi:DoxX family protein [Rhizobacter sp. Root1221]|uniref:DoxX family protein n=1 Tax=Rhizobacter sp. Root1221 TaxID=1736433 RepID=UPI0006F4ABA6|nr:DoxX family protein [Rhizobacter sp. Root1221]KQV89777.1 LysR family transcriptional regulator [Rhizobacter sp. Root1221]
MRDASIAAVGRFLLAALFLISGLSKLGATAATTSYIASAGLPLPGVAYAITLLVEIGGGLLLLIGFQAKPVAVVLALFTLGAAIFFHNNFADQNQAIHFVKNLAIAGGLLQVAAAGAGRLSLDARRLQQKA